MEPFLQKNIINEKLPDITKYTLDTIVLTKRWNRMFQYRPSEATKLKKNSANNQTYNPYTLAGPYVTKPVPDPLAVLSLEN